jgi:hypothetical protein
MATSKIRADNNLIYRTVLTSANDMNTVIQPGFYYQVNASMPSNSPTDAYNASIFVFRARNRDVIQFWLSVNSRTAYIRQCYDMTTWSEWKTAFSWM